MKATRLLVAIFLGLAVLALAASPAAAQEGQAAPASSAFKFLSAAIAFTASAIGAGFAVAKAGSAGLAGIAERPEIRTSAIIITALGEAIAIYGIVIAILILGQAA